MMTQAEAATGGITTIFIRAKRFMHAERAKALVILLAFALVSLAGMLDLGPAQIRDAMVTSLLGPPPAPAPAATAGQIGRIKTVSGTVWVVHRGQHLPAETSSPLDPEDVIETGADGSVGITLVDDSIFSAGPNSQLALAEFSFDVDTGKGNILAELKKGTVSVVSGAITHATPGAMNIKTPTSILGVRGTSFVVRVGED